MALDNEGLEVSHAPDGLDVPFLRYRLTPARSKFDLVGAYRARLDKILRKVHGGGIAVHDGGAEGHGGGARRVNEAVLPILVMRERVSDCVAGEELGEDSAPAVPVYFG